MAPLIAALVKMGLPVIADAVIQKGKEVVEEKLGIELKPEMTDAEIAIAADKQIEHKEFLINAAQKEFETEVADRRDAREMQRTALTQDDLFAKRFVYHLATGCLLFTGVYVFFITFNTIPQQNIRFADTILGFLLGTMVSTIIYFFFGTSKSSAAKDEFKTSLIHKLTGKG